MSLILKLALAPLLAAQALTVRRRAQVLPEPDGPRAGQLGSGPDMRLLIVGDSSAAGVGATHQSRALAGQITGLLAEEHALTWRLEARTGATTAATIEHLSSLPSEPFDVAIVALGVNDVTRLVPPRRWLDQQTQLHRLLQDLFSARLIVRSALPPMGQFPLLPQPLRHILGRDAARLDAALAKLCDSEENLVHVPLDLPFEAKYVAEDGFHPSEAAYARWAQMLQSTLTASLDETHLS